MPKFIFVFIAILISCGGSSNDEPVTAVEIKLSEEKQFIDDSVYLDSLPSVVYFETNEQSVIRRVDRVFMYDNHILILDKSQGKILFFDLEGRYIRDIQKLGRGSGEYLQIADMLVDEERKEVVLLCSRPYRILRLNFQGEFIKSMPVHRLYKEFAMDSQSLYAYSAGTPNAVRENELFQIDVLDTTNNGQLKEAWLKQSEFSYFNHMTEGNAVNLSDALLVSRRFDNKIYEITDGKLETRYEFDFGYHNFPEIISKIDDFDEYTTSKEIIYTITDAVESAKSLIFQSNIGTFIFDKDNGILTRYAAGMRSADFSLALGDYKVIGNRRGHLAFFAHPTRIKVMEKMYKEGLSPENDAMGQEMKNFLSFSEKISIDDNPVMLVYKMK